MLRHLLFVLACFGHFSAEARLISNQDVAKTMDQQIRDHLGNVNKVTQCKYSPDEVVKIGLGAKLVNAKESISKIETFRYDKNFYKLSISFTDSCSTTVIPDSPPPTSAYVLYICGGNFWSLLNNYCSFLEGDGGCPYTQTGPFIEWDWNGNWSAMGCLD